MNLHFDKEAFAVLINSIHNRTGYRTDVLEKDYYVVLILEELANKQLDGLPAYFKGGTALYKSLKTTNRFSEDIDLSVETRGCSATQNKKRLEQATKKYSSLQRLKEEGKTNKSEVITVYSYDPITIIDVDDELQRFGKVKIEATSFTISEPVFDLEIAPMIYDLANQNEKSILEATYGVHPFSIKTITLERIFVDKLFAAESYVEKSYDSHRAFEAAKHIYDLAVLYTNPTIQALMYDSEKMDYLITIRLKEELGRLDGIPGRMPQDFKFFNTVENNNSVRTAYETMQKQYVFKEEDRIEYDDAVKKLLLLSKLLNQNKVWNR